MTEFIVAHVRSFQIRSFQHSGAQLWLVGTGAERGACSSVSLTVVNTI